jgi:CheY-like chemotaxis protein
MQDNKVNQRVALRMLEKCGVRCDLAENGLVALQMHEVCACAARWPCFCSAH